MDINEAMVEGFYSRYISRDLADLLGGGVFIVIIWYSFRNQLLGISWSGFLPPILWEQPLRLISFLAVCYLVGFFFDKIGDELAPKIVPFHCKYESIGFFKLKTPPPNPFEVLNKIKFPGYESNLVLRQDLIVKGKYDNRILDQLERLISLWILGKSLGLSAICGSVVIIIVESYFKNSNLFRYDWIIVIVLFFSGLYILRQGSEAWRQYHQELFYLFKNMKDSINKEKLEKSK